MKISIVIPTYTPGSYLWECLDALTKQTFPKEQFEVIIVLNGCNEPYFSAINNYIQEKVSLCQFKLYHIAHSGVSNARNYGISQSKGKYLCFIDDDDWVTPDFLSSLYSLTEDKDDVLVLSNVKSYNENDNKFENNFLSNCFIKNQKSDKHTLLSTRSYFSSVCAKLIPINMIGERRFLLQFKRLEDALFMAQISDKAKDIRFSSSSTIYFYRIRYGSASHKNLKLQDFLKENLKQAFAFIRIYLSNPKEYNFLFFCTRLLAISRTILKGQHRRLPKIQKQKKQVKK